MRTPWPPAGARRRTTGLPGAPRPHTAPTCAGEPAWADRLAGDAAVGQPGPAAEEPAGVGVLAPLIRVAWLRGDDEARDAVRAVLGSGRPVEPALLGIWGRAVVEDAEQDDEIQQLLHGYARPATVDGMSPDQRAMAFGTIGLSRHETALAIRHLRLAAQRTPKGGLHLPMALGGLAWAHFDAGDLDVAIELAGRTIAELPGDVPPGHQADVVADIRAGALAALATVAVLRAAPDVDDRLRDALDAVQPGRHAAHHLRLERARGLAAERDGHSELAYLRLRRLYHADGRPVHHRISDLGIADLAHVAVAIGSGDEVAPIVAAAGPRIRALRSRRISVLRHRALGLLAGTDPAAESQYRLALADPGGDQWPVERAFARLDYAQWLRRRQRPGESRPILATAGEVFGAAKLTGWAARAAAELDAAAPRRRSGPAAVSELTPQQRQVVALAAQGLTNQQIAARLDLSPRTVSTHLSRAFAVLGVTRRAQLPSVIDPS